MLGSLNVPSAAIAVPPEADISIIPPGARISCVSITCWPASGRPCESNAVPDAVTARPGTSEKSMLTASWPTVSGIRRAFATTVVPGKYVVAYPMTISTSFSVVVHVSRVSARRM